MIIARYCEISCNWPRAFANHRLVAASVISKMTSKMRLLIHSTTPRHLNKKEMNENSTFFCCCGKFIILTSMLLPWLIKDLRRRVHNGVNFINIGIRPPPMVFSEISSIIWLDIVECSHIWSLLTSPNKSFIKMFFLSHSRIVEKILLFNRTSLFLYLK